MTARSGPGEIVGDVPTSGGTAVPAGAVTDAHGQQMGRTGVDPHERFAVRGLPPST